MYTIKYIFLATVLTVALTFFMLGQDTYGDKHKSDMKHHGTSEMLGKPTVDVTVDDLHMKIWLVTQKQHDELMKGEIDQKIDKGREGAMGPMQTIGIQRTSSIVKKMEDTSWVKEKDMKGVKVDSKKSEWSTKDSVLTGTHHIMLDVIDAESGNEIDDGANVKIDIVSPSDKNSSVDLTAMMMNHFGGALILDEEGEYDFILSVNVNGVSTTTQFQHTVK